MRKDIRLLNKKNVGKFPTFFYFYEIYAPVLELIQLTIFVPATLSILIVGLLSKTQLLINAVVEFLIVIVSLPKLQLEIRIPFALSR